MQQLTDEGRRIVEGVAQRNGFSTDAVISMLYSVSAGYGNQAQFNHPEFGGMGQWSSGGMVMIGDMFNNYLKGRVANLCQELANLIQGQSMFMMPAQSQSQSQGGAWQGQFGGNNQQQSSGGGSWGTSLFVQSGNTGNWWPGDLGMAGSTGAQNNLRYAYFPGARRLAIDNNGQVSVYDTGDHQIGGFGQQQGGDQSLTFNSQYGIVRVADLPRINPAGSNSFPAQANLGGNSFSNATPPVAPAPELPANVAQQVSPLPSMQAAAPAPIAPAAIQVPPAEIFSLIEKLADLHAKGILSVTEYETKKAELLSRL